jgi:chromosome segregation ATPase
MSIASSEVDLAENTNGRSSFIKMAESGQIGFRLAEEVRTLREQILALKQEKRILLVNNQNLDEGLQSANSTIAQFKASIDGLSLKMRKYRKETAKKVNAVIVFCCSGYFLIYFYRIP